MEKLLKSAAQAADQAEVLHVVKKSSPVNFYNWRQIDVLDRMHDEVSLRVIKNGRIGTVKGSATEDTRWMVEAAVRAAELGPEVQFDFPDEPSQGCGAKISDPDLLDMDSGRMLEDGREIYEYIRSRYPDLPLNLYFDNEKTTVTVLNTSGKNESYTRTKFTACLLSMYKRSKEGINKEFTACRYFKIPETILDELISENRLSEKELKAPTKKMPVLFRASSTWSLLYRILEGANGMHKVNNLTPLKDKIGQKIFGGNITLIDDPTRDWAPGSTPFDDEGVPTKQKMIVESGVFRNFIFDLNYGAKDGNGSTGNGIKRDMWTSGIEVTPNPRFNNLVMEPGEMKFEDMISGIDEGIIVNDVIGFHSGNILQGQYSMNVGIGFYVKRGKILGRVMDTMIAGNIYEDFHRVIGIGNELRFNPIAYSPDILIDGVSVSGTAG